MSRQKALEGLALKLARTPQIRAAREQARTIMLAAPEARTPSGIARLDDALDQHVYAAIQRATNLDPQYPEVLVISQYAHALDGQEFPAALHGGMENPDNVYRIVPLDGESRYVLHGRRHPHPPAQVTYDVMDSVPGVHGIGRQIALLGNDDLVVDADGRYAITIDPQGANGRANHLRSDGQTRALLIRDTLSDWSRQLPDSLRIERLDPPATPPRGEREILDEAVRLVPAFLKFWLDFRLQHLKANGHRRVNCPDLPEVRPGGWGFISNTSFRLGDDEALAITLHPFGARYLGALVADPWWVGLDCARHTGSLNAAQAWSNADGSYTFVIAPRDPGVHNWLDTAGIHEGYIQLRWQGLDASVTSAQAAILGARLARTAELESLLPAETVWVTPEQRKVQLAARHASYRRRLEV